MASGLAEKEVARLVAHFEGVLETLNTNIHRYREAKVAEFSSQYQEQLANIPHAVANQVRKAVAISIFKYPELRGFTIDLQDDIDPSSLSCDKALLDPAEIVAAPAHVAVNETRREHEFDLAGFFTPGYLPLLDASKAAIASSSPPPQSPATADPDQHDSLRSSPEPSTPTTAINSSMQGDCSRRRSALRRSSSASKSPRKVRFDIGGDDSDSGGGVGKDDKYQSDDNEYVAKGGTVSKYTPSLLDDPDEPPPPKKVSSVERLRLLGRRPYKTQEESDADAPPPGLLAKETRANTTVNAESIRSRSNDTSIQSLKQKPPSKLSPVHTLSQPTLDLNEPEAKMAASISDNEEDDFLEIKSKRSKKICSSSVQISPTNPQALNPLCVQIADKAPNSVSSESTTEFIASGMATRNNQRQQINKAVTRKTIAQKSKERHDHDDDDDELFEFEDENSASRTKRPLTPIDDAEEDEEIEEHGSSEKQTGSIANITKPVVPTVTSIPQGVRPSTPQPIHSEAVGSYRGRPLSMPIVKDFAVYEAAASMGEFNTFVGGIDGTSGMDEGDLNSFRASVMALTTGTPKSFSERMLIEDSQRGMIGQHQHNFGSLPVGRRTPSRRG